MQKYIVLLFLACFLAFPAIGNGSEYSKKLFVVVTTGDPVTQLMSMVLATQTMKKGATVMFFFVAKQAHWLSRILRRSF